MITFIAYFCMGEIVYKVVGGIISLCCELVFGVRLFLQFNNIYVLFKEL